MRATSEFNFASKPVKAARANGTLEIEDLPSSLRNIVKTRDQHDRFAKVWEVQQTKEKPRIILAVVAGQVPRVLFTAILYLISQGSTVTGPLLIQRIVSGLSCREKDDPSGCSSKKELFMCGPTVLSSTVIQVRAVCDNFPLVFLCIFLSHLEFWNTGLEKWQVDCPQRQPDPV